MKENMLPHREQWNNEGFTLVEVLVSMAVLAIILIPIISNLAVSSRMNVTSRKEQEVTVLGQNIMEGLKIEPSFENVATQMIYKDKGVPFELFQLDDLTSLKTSQVELKDGKYQEVSTPCIKEEKDPSDVVTGYEFIPNVDRKYEFALENLIYNKKSYCALVTYDAGVYSDDTGVTENINDKDIPVIPSVAAKTNAVITQGYRDKWAESTLLDHYNKWFNTYQTGDNKQSNDTIQDDMVRTFTITLDYDATSKKYIVEATVLYELSTLIPKAGPTEEAEYKKFREYSDTLYRGEFDEIENIYLFFTPNLIQESDTLYFKNNVIGDGGNVTLYLVEQSQIPKYGTYDEKIASYHLEFYLEESDPMTKPTGAKLYRTTLKHNLGVNSMADTSNIIVKHIGALDELNQKDFIEREADKTRIYNIKVRIYETPKPGEEYFQDDDLISSFTSTKGE